ncbi:MAG: pyruvate formate lyase family protein, partial [Thermodesulfobacteriota bacterium]
MRFLPSRKIPNLANLLTRLFMHFFALNFNLRPGLKRYLGYRDGWFNFTFGVQTRNKSVNQGIKIEEGRIRVLDSIPQDLDAQLLFLDESAIKELLVKPPNKHMITLMENRMVTNGNLSYVQVVNFYLSLLLKGSQIRKLKKESRSENREYDHWMATKRSIDNRKLEQLSSQVADPGVKWLPDPYLPNYSLSDFPRLSDFLELHLGTKPEICHERPEILTHWYRNHGFEQDESGRPWVPELRQANAFNYLMQNKKPIIRENDLIAGTTTTKEVGVVLYPDAHGTLIWSELLTVPYRPVNPYEVSDETVEKLHFDIFPYWTKRNFREWVRKEKNSPLCQKLDERFAACFLWKTVALSHTIIDYPRVLQLGTKGIMQEIEQEMGAGADNHTYNQLLSMRLCLEGINIYAKNLSREAQRLAGQSGNTGRKLELERLARICDRVPEHPCTTLDEAVNAVWILWVGVHMENTNAGFSLGRLDQWLQPYFEADMEKLATYKEREEYIKHAIELVGCLFMRCTDHLPLIPDIGNYLFGGSSSDQAITLGGVTPKGEDAVNDMTYIFLKVTELLSIRDPNVNARYNAGKNTDTYLKRLCEVNLNTTATPSIHNDEAVMNSLQEFNYPVEHLRDWSAIGCVEPTLSGRHIGHTGCMMFNMVAAMEMALNNGYHPLMQWDLGPKTGDISAGSFDSFEDFFAAFEKQLT